MNNRGNATQEYAFGQRVLEAAHSVVETLGTTRPLMGEPPPYIMGGIRAPIEPEPPRPMMGKPMAPSEPPGAGSGMGRIVQAREGSE